MYCRWFIIIQANNLKETWKQVERESRSLSRKGERRKLKNEPRRYGHLPSMKKKRNMFSSDFNSICFKCNILVRAAEIPASKTTPVEKVSLSLLNIFILSGWLHVSTMTNNWQAPDFSDCCIICVGSTGAGKSSTVGEIRPCLWTNASWSWSAATTKHKIYHQVGIFIARSHYFSSDEG